MGFLSFKVAKGFRLIATPRGLRGSFGGKNGWISTGETGIRLGSRGMPVNMGARIPPGVLHGYKEHSTGDVSEISNDLILDGILLECDGCGTSCFAGWEQKEVSCHNCGRKENLPFIPGETHRVARAASEPWKDMDLVLLEPYIQETLGHKSMRGFLKQRCNLKLPDGAVDADVLFNYLPERNFYNLIEKHSGSTFDIWWENGLKYTARIMRSVYGWNANIQESNHNKRISRPSEALKSHIIYIHITDGDVAEANAPNFEQILREYNLRYKPNWDDDIIIISVHGRNSMKVALEIHGMTSHADASREKLNQVPGFRIVSKKRYDSLGGIPIDEFERQARDRL